MQIVFTGLFQINHSARQDDQERSKRRVCIFYCCAGTKGCVFQQLRSCGKNFTHRTAPQLQAAVSCIFLTQLDVLAERIVELVVEAAVSAARKLRAAVSCHSQAAQCEREL